MTEPTVSIILPTYNGSRYLEQAVRSCLAQTYADFELVIVDDCSTDSTPQIIAALAAGDARIRPLRNDPNRRLPASLNVGFQHARGRYLTWTSDDNLYRPTAIGEMVAALEADPALGLVYARMTDIDAEGKPLGPGFTGPPEWMAHCNPVGACFMYRRDVYAAVGDYAVDLFLAEDWDYWFRIAERYPIGELPQDLYLYRRHEGSLTQQKRQQVMEAGWRLLERHVPRMQWVGRSARSRGYVAAARYAWRAGEHRRAISFAGRALSESPFSFVNCVVQSGFNPLRRKQTPATVA